MTEDLKELYEYGYEVFGNKTKFHLWLERSCHALNNKTPISLLNTKEDVKIVRRILSRIEHGIIS